MINTKTYRNIYKFLHKKTKYYKYISYIDLEYLYSVSQHIYRRMLVEHNVTRYDNPELYQTEDAHFRIWEINGPMTTLSNSVDIYMFCMSKEKFYFNDDLLRNLPFWLENVSENDNFQPNGTCFKIKVS